jgi:hypothetical protein
MDFIEFKKYLLDADLTIPKFARLIKVSEKNIQSYKDRDHIPNSVAVVAAMFATMHAEGIDYKKTVENLELKKKSKNSGFGRKKR